MFNEFSNFSSQVSDSTMYSQSYAKTPQIYFPDKMSIAFHFPGFTKNIKTSCYEFNSRTLGDAADICH